MEELLEMIVGALFEAVGDVLLEGLFYVVFEYPFERLERWGPRFRLYRSRFAIGWYLLIGVLVGFAGARVVPTRMVHQILIPGFSVVVVPLLTGGLMRVLGKGSLVDDPERRSPIFTFWGGWAFAFGVAAVRFLMVA